MLGAPLVTRRHVEGIRHPPDARVDSLALRAAQFAVAAANVVVEKRRQIQPMATRWRRHAIEREREGTVRGGEIAAHVQRQSEQRVAPPLCRATRARYT